MDRRRSVVSVGVSQSVCGDDGDCVTSLSYSTSTVLVAMQPM